jgi:hypothetical protein
MQSVASLNKPTQRKKRKRETIQIIRVLEIAFGVFALIIGLLLTFLAM